MSDLRAQQLVAEFRETRGQVSGPMARSRVLLLTTTDAETGEPVTAPVNFLHGGRPGSLVVIAVPVGDALPAWYRDVLADPRVRLETGAFDIEARAKILQGEERQTIFARAAEAYPELSHAAERAGEPLPVIALTTVAGRPSGHDSWGDSLKVLHDSFRRELALVRQEIARSGPRLGAQLRINCLLVCGGLDHHHRQEDGQMLHTVAERHPELAPVVARVRQEHEAMHGLLAEMQQAISEESGDPASARAEFDRLAGLVEAHLDYEEEQLVPILNEMTP